MRSSVACKSQEEVFSIVSQLKSICEFDSAILALIKRNETGEFHATSWINHSYPNQWLEAYQKGRFAAVDPVIQMHAPNPGTRCWKDIYSASPPPKYFLSASKDHGLNEGWTTGLPVQERNEISLMSFSWTRSSPKERQGALLHLAGPHLHQALIRSIGSNCGRSNHVLTSKESEVLAWVKQGKSNWEIASIQGISERTVKFHIANVMAKLNAVNRGHAIAVAMERGL